MKPLMKKLVLTMAAVSLLILGGCSSNDQKNDKKAVIVRQKGRS